MTVLPVVSTASPVTPSAARAALAPGVGVRCNAETWVISRRFASSGRAR